MEQQQNPETVQGVHVTGKRSPRWAFMSKMEIPSTRNAGENYLVRLRLIQTPWFGVYLHRVLEPDYDFSPHDHPWNFGSLILRGGYTEHIWNNPSYHDEKYFERRWLRWSWHKMRMGQAHKIVGVMPGTISLIFVGKRHETWGFYTPEGWIDWKVYKEVNG
jgi:hypothetical protein